MATVSALDILPIVQSRAGRWRQASQRNVAIYVAANSLWNDEYETWLALMRLGLRDAANCAWERRSAASDLSRILASTL